MMEGTAFLPLPQGLRITEIHQEEMELTVEVLSERTSACCPLCEHSSDAVHSRYQRRLKDVPCGGQADRLHLTVRKFFCRNPECQRKIFTERVPAFVEPWAQMTIRLSQAIQAIGLSTSGSLGARLAARLGIATSWMTILHCIMELPGAMGITVTVLGIDDFSFRRGHKFGTILVGVSRHQVIDLLPERKAESAATWMRSHPEIQYVSRDRGTDYAQAAREGAPQAIQSADRFHLMKNLVEAIEPVVHKVKVMETPDGPKNVPGMWDFPKGGVKPGETAQEAIMREVREETGASRYRIIKQFDEKICFSFDEHYQQETTMFLIEYLGDRSELHPMDEEIDHICFFSAPEVYQYLAHQETKDFFVQKIFQNENH